jgi:hypothetical protein
MSRLATLLAALALSQTPPAGEPPPATPPAAAPAPAPAPAPARDPAAAPAPGAKPAPATPPRLRDPAAERAEAEKVAQLFAAALAAGDADALAAAAGERFSFDGNGVTGRDAIRRTWRSLLALRAGPAPRVGAVEVLTVQEAVARLGPTPARLVPLTRPGALVALADVGGRPVVLFVAREGGRMAVLGMHD